MQESYQRLLKGNEEWVKERLAQNPEFFSRNAKGQSPEFLWIGCSDSRVPANEITNTEPGDIFVHRNIANLVVHTDLNLLSVLQFAVDVLKVKHVIVCGHYGCGGIATAMSRQNKGLVNKWLSNIKEVYVRNAKQLDLIEDFDQRADRMVELNVIEQVHNLAKTSIVQRAWQNRTLQIHGWVYDIYSGHIKDLNVMVHELDDLEPIFRFINPQGEGDE